MIWHKCDDCEHKFPESEARWREAREWDDTPEGLRAIDASYLCCPMCASENTREFAACETCVWLGLVPNDSAEGSDECREHILQHSRTFDVDPHRLAKVKT